MPGSVVFAGIEGCRPLLVEFQALVARSALTNPRRAVVGWAAGRLATLLAILAAGCGISFLGQDVYLDVSGGIRVSKPAADLAVVAAPVFARDARPTSASAVVFGEVGMPGTLRQINQLELRLKEVEKLGYTGVIAPRGTKRFVSNGV